MEVIVPLFALSSFYVINNQNKKKNKDKESFANLPNTNIPNQNYPTEYPIVSTETDQTTELSNNNKFGGNGVYTDKYFNQQTPVSEGSPEFYSMSGEKVGTGYFQHNNMVPFFGSNLRGSMKSENETEGLLDSYTGSGSQTVTKSEQSPLFAPDENTQWAHGVPNQSDFIQSRVNPSMKMSNVNPFKEESVAPGLGLGFTSEGSGGFNSGMAEREQWQPKTVDNLRVENNPKSGGNLLYGHEGPALHAIKNNATPEQMGVVEKNRPDTSFEMSSDRWFTTGGLEKGQTSRAVNILKNVTRPETTTDYTGGAGAHNNASYNKGEYMPSHNQDLGARPFGVASAPGHNKANVNDHGINAKMAYPNNRSANKQDSYFGMVSGGMGSVIAPLLDVLRPSRKENTIGSLRPYQNAGTAVSNSYMYNPKDTLPTTIRETTENSKFHMNVNSNQNGGAYKVTQQQATHTTRQETGDFYYAGGSSAAAGTKKTTSYEAGYNQRNNDIKSSTIEGRLVKGNMSLLNSDVNMRVANKDEYLKNSRPVSGNMPYKSPDASTMGRLAGNDRSLKSDIQTERTNTDILSSLNSNPYVIDHTKGL